MSEEPTAPLTPEERLREREAFNKCADAIEPLSHEARIRLFRILTTHFDIPSAQETQAAPRFPTGATWPGASTTAPTPSSFSEDRSLSAKQFMIMKKPLTDVERVACLAYYLTHYREQPYFKTLDLSKLNTEAAQVKFSNAAKAVDNASTKVYLSQAGGGKKQLSAHGELYVQALPDREAARAAMAHARPRRRVNKPKDDATEEE